MMPLLYSLGQHGALEAANDRLTRDERLFIVIPTAAEVDQRAVTCVRR